MKKILSLLIVLILLAGVGALLFIPAAYKRTPESNAPVIHVTIPEDANASRVASILVERKLLSSTMGYRFYSLLNRTADSPRAGTYDLSFGMNYREIARILARGPARDEETVRVIEGWTIDDILSQLVKQGVTSTTVTDFDAKTYRDEYTFLKDLPADATLEGYLFPDTYRVWKDQLPYSLIEKQLEEFDDKTEAFVAKAAEQGRSFHDVVILASIVEKEALHDEDRPLIASVFLNRLKDGMRLQSDATLNYVLKTGRSRLTNADLETDSPYNSYMYAGLPPGPIGNPSLASLEAALQPAISSYYFFLSDASGKVYYAKTHEEHVQNRYKAFGE